MPTYNLHAFGHLTRRSLELPGLGLNHHLFAVEGKLDDGVFLLPNKLGHLPNAAIAQLFGNGDVFQEDDVRTHFEFQALTGLDQCEQLQRKIDMKQTRVNKESERQT